MNVTLVVNGQDMAPVLATYSVGHETEYENEIRTMDRKVHRFGEATRTVLRFSVYPRADGHQEDARALRQRPLTVRFSDPEYGTIRQLNFDNTKGNAATYALHNVLGDDIYKIAQYVLEAVEVDNETNIGNV